MSRGKYVLYTQRGRTLPAYCSVLNVTVKLLALSSQVPTVLTPGRDQSSGLLLTAGCLDYRIPIELS